MSRRTQRGVTILELLIVMFILSILAAYISYVALQVGGAPRIKRTIADLQKISLALDAYRKRFRTYPPDTGYGLQMENVDRPLFARERGGRTDMVPTYDPGSLWRYLIMEVHVPDPRYPDDPAKTRTYGPFLEEWPGEQLKPYNDPLVGPSYYLSDPWGNLYGFRGERKRIIHNHGSFDLFSAGPDGLTACNDGAGADCSQEADGFQDPNSTTVGDNRAYNTQPGVRAPEERDDDGNDIANDSAEFGQEAARNGDMNNDINNWSPH